MSEIRDMDQLITHLIPLLQKQFSNDISYVFYGDIGVYPPQAFKGPNKEERLSLSITPNYDRPVPKSRSASSEFRELGVYLMLMINMIPYFERLPDTAFGERRLVQTVNKMRAFLQQDKNLDLQNKVITSSVEDIRWDWQARGKDNYLRTAAIEFQVTVEIDRLEF